MEKEFVTYEIALRLKALGFDEPCFGYYDEGGNLYTEMQEYLPAPTWQSAFRWFREKHNLFGIVYSDLSWNITGGIANTYGDTYDWDSEKFKTYEESQESCLLNLCDIVESSKVQHKKEKVTLEEAYKIAEKKKMTHILEDFLKESQGMSVEEIVDDFISHYNLHSN